MSHTAWVYADSILLGGATRIVASDDGYLWLASTRGVIRFDGMRFTVLDSTDTPALRSRRSGMFTPRVASRGTLWISRPDGAVVSYREGRFRVVIDSIPGRETTIIADSSGHVFVWARGRDWLGQIDDTGRLDSVPLPPLAGRTLIGVMVDDDGGLWVGAQSATLWHRTGATWRAVDPPERSDYGPIMPLLRARDGTLWVTYRGWLYRRSGERWKRVIVPGRPGVAITATQVVEDRTGSIWITANNAGVLRWHDGALDKYEVSDGLTGASGLSIHVNDVGVAWFTTGAGLDRLRVAPLSAMAGVGSFTMTSTVRMVQDVAGFAWAEMESGRAHARFDGGAIRGTSEPLVADSVHMPGTPDRGYQFLEAARSGGAWVGPSAGGLGRITTTGYQVLDERVGVPSKRHWRLLEASDGSMWLAGLFTGVGRIRNGRYSPVTLPGFAEPAVASFAEDGRGDVWISMDRSPTVFAVRGDSVVRRLDASRGVRDTVLRLVAERGDTLWGVGTRSLVRIVGDRAVTIETPSLPHLRGPSVRRLSGVPSLGAFRADDRLWIVGEGGIAHYSVTQLHAAADGSGALPRPTRLDALDGIPVPAARSLTLDPVSATRDGRFWIRTPTGFATLDPRRVIDEPRAPRPIVEEVLVGGRRVPLDGPLEIGPNPERVEIRVTATAAAFPERVRVEHRLDGAETGWVHTGPSRTVAYTQLRPGSYTFRLRVPNEAGGEVAPDATLAFRVVPAWYQAYWFAGLVVLLIAAGGPAAVYTWLRHRSRLREAGMQARFDAALAERTRVARELHDTLLQGFTGITLQLQGVLRTIERSPAQATERLAQTLSLADATLLDARQSIWDMRVPELRDRDLASALEGAAMQAVADTPIKVRFQVRGRTRRLAPLLESTALRIGREAAHNAVRHANPSAIDIDLVYTDEHIDLSVRDDGRGFETSNVRGAAQPGHWGVSGMRERAESAGGAFDIRGMPGAGTIVSLRLPIGADVRVAERRAPGP